MEKKDEQRERRMMINDTVIHVTATLGTLLCFALLGINAVWLITNLCRRRSHRIPYIRNYKKGGFILNYPIMILIYFIGILYEERSVFDAFAASIVKAADFVRLYFSTAEIRGLMTDNPLYAITVYGGYALIVVGTVLLTLSLLQQHLWCAYHSLLAKVSRKESLYLFGYHPDNIDICRSDANRRNVCVIANLSREACERLYIENIPYQSISYQEWTESKLPTLFRRRVKKSIFIINTGSDTDNAELCKCFAAEITKATEKKREEMFSRVRIYVLGDPSYRAIYENAMKRGYGCIQYVNKYQKIATDLIARYPLALFMDEDRIDYAKALVKRDVDINVLLVGFGKVNRQILLSSVAINQFMTDSEDGPVHKPVNYFVFDKGRAEQDKNLNHDYYRFRDKRESIDPDQYLPLPPLPAEVEYSCVDVNDADFYKQIKAIVTGKPQDANFIVVSFGNDLENLDMAHKLVEKCDEWESQNTIIFVRAFGWHKDQTPIESDRCCFFGNESTTVFDIDKLLSDRTYHMAKMRNVVFELEHDMDKGKEIPSDADSLQEYIDKLHVAWYRSKLQIERESTLFACLSLRSKLNLMGLDLCDKQSPDDVGLSEAEFMRRYGGENFADTVERSWTVNGKRIAFYDIDAPSECRRNLAILEHNRWVAFALSRGMVPATRDQILSETVWENGTWVHTDGKNYALRRHGHLTTFAGLAAFGAMIAYRLDDHESKTRQLIRYRYQLLDDAYTLLTENGYKIVEKAPAAQASSL